MINNRIKDQDFYKTMYKIAIPVVIQHVISIGLNLIDSVMIGGLGEISLAAVGIANRVFFFYTVVVFGLYSGTSIFISQYWGVKDIKNIRKVLGIELIFGVSIAFIFTLITFITPGFVMKIFINDSNVITQGTNYLRIISFSYVIGSISYAFSFNSRSVHLLKVPTIISAFALSLNTILNYLLIYGKFGFPALGVKGAAYATVMARIVEFISVLIYIYKDKNHPLAASIKELLSWDMDLVKRIFKTSFPVIANESIWGLGTTVYYIAYGMIGSAALAVIQVQFLISDFFMSLFFGLGSASAVMIGNELGKNNLESTYSYGKFFIKSTFYLSLIFSVILFLLRNIIISFYNFEPATVIMLRKTLVVSAIYLTPKMLSYVIICGILRSGGDTKFCMVLDIINIWLIGVPLAFISVMIFHLPVHLVLALVLSEEIIKNIVVLKRFKSKKWINNLIY